ncbi:hypothetical protein VPH35_098686 [Triticum aestivum]|nr:uncharacterized protein LOC123120726 [Triticum aestivum]
MPSDLWADGRGSHKSRATGRVVRPVPRAQTFPKNQIPEKKRGKRQREKRAKAARPPAPPQPPPLVPPPPPRPARALPAPVGLDPASAPRDSAGGACPRVERQEEGSSSRAPCSAGARASTRPWQEELEPRTATSIRTRQEEGSSSRASWRAGAPRRNLRLLLRDAAEDDEAVAAYALKWLGFALYHPVLISTISGQLAQSILATLVRLIMTTKMKAICNLAVWCISVQQLEASVVEDGLTPLLNAIVYALDNPFGSLSTTFEAIQGGKTNCS